MFEQIPSWLIIFVAAAGPPAGKWAFKKLSAAGGSMWQKYRDGQAVRISTEATTAVEMAKLEELKKVDLSKIKRDDFQALNDAAVDIAQLATMRLESAEKRAEAAEVALDQFKREFKNFSAEFEQMKIENAKNATVQFQLEQGIRMLCDTFNIAYWAITPAGHLEGNLTFFETLTGLTAEECHNDGWFAAIDEPERENVTQLWKQFLRRSETRPTFNFTFRHKSTGKSVKTKVFCLPVMLDGMTVYKFTAQTAPLQIN